MLERSAPECTRGRIAFRRAERRRPARRRATRIPRTWTQSFTDPDRAARVRAAAPAVDALFAEALGELGAPGLAYGVALDGELVHSGGCGVRDLESGAAPDADTAFRICSMTKSFMAMAVLSLRDEGRLDIDAPLGEVAPDLRALARGRAATRRPSPCASC